MERKVNEKLPGMCIMRQFVMMAALLLVGMTIGSCSVEDNAVTVVEPETPIVGRTSPTVRDSVISGEAVLTGEFDTTNPIKFIISPGAKVTLKNFSIKGKCNNATCFSGLTCNGNATLILEGENTVSSFHRDCPGIRVPQDSTLTITGTGKLTASCSDGESAGIGGGRDYLSFCGNIVIQNGTVIAKGGYGAAGIGGGHTETGTSSCGNITIAGGTVEASGGENGAGIGSGSVFPDNGNASCGNITISGGTVTATGGYGAAGIGCGRACLAKSSSEIVTSCGDITISGGTVTATGGYGATGIGSAYTNRYLDERTFISSSCNNITISGGMVTATGGEYAAAIGSGYGGTSGNQFSKCGDINISGGVITATSGYKAANIIGKSLQGHDNSVCGTVTISPSAKTYLTQTESPGSDNHDPLLSDEPNQGGETGEGSIPNQGGEPVQGDNPVQGETGSISFTPVFKNGETTLTGITGSMTVTFDNNNTVPTYYSAGSITLGNIEPKTYATITFALKKSGKTYSCTLTNVTVTSGATNDLGEVTLTKQ